jgi:hypothetical protein
VVVVKLTCAVWALSLGTTVSKVTLDIASIDHQFPIRIFAPYLVDLAVGLIPDDLYRYRLSRGRYWTQGTKLVTNTIERSGRIEQAV